ncbi:MAG: hypothetical protein KDB01_14385, partial [Planctomycetaceae bacterium]|nr:hypothetical protein [Planctomycetaceae bacterium]
MDSFDSLSHATSEEITFFHPVFDASCPEQYVLNPEPLQVLTWKTGSGVLVSIPPEYAATLDRVRAARLRKEMDFFPAAARTAADQADHEALGNYLCRALPEEFVPNVNRMPCPSLVRRIVLLDGSNPMDALVRQLDGDPKYCSAAQPTPNGEVFFFQTFTNEWLGSLLTHPWAHLLRWDLERSL